MLIAFCGLMMFRNIERMPPHEKVEAFSTCLTANRGSTYVQTAPRHRPPQPRYRLAFLHSASAALVTCGMPLPAAPPC